MSKIRILGVQMSVSTKLDENLPKILDHIQGGGADFILFPEMCLTGYHGGFSQKAVESACEQIETACRLHYVTALIGTGWKEEGHSYIQTRILGDTGELIGTQEKLVPTEDDRTFCRPGEELRTFEHRGINFGCLICNDLWVAPGCGPYPDPRLSYQLGKRGARIIFHSIHSGSDQTHTAYHESNLVLRAMESKVHICTANAVDTKGPVNALSGVVSPQGHWVVQCPRLDEQTYIFDLDLAAD